MFEFFVSVVLITLTLYYYFLLADNILGSNGMSTSLRARKKIFEIIGIHAPQAHIFYDLGCGHGSLSIATQKKFPQFTTYGIDNNYTRIVVSKIRGWILQSPVSFVHKNFFDINLRNVDVVYAYLLKECMPPLEKKLLLELKQGAIIITSTNFLPTWKPIETYVTKKGKRFEKLFVYRKT